MLNIKGKNTNIPTGKTESVVETPSQRDVSEPQTVPHEWHWRIRSACEQGSGLSDPPDHDLGFTTFISFPCTLKS